MLTRRRGATAARMNPFSATVEKLRGQGIARAFRHRDFAIYSAGNWGSTIGMWVQRVGVLLSPSSPPS